jgi:hypothetical protein
MHTAHEMTEALDTRYQSDLGEAIMAECVALLEEVSTDFPSAETHKA